MSGGAFWRTGQMGSTPTGPNAEVAGTARRAERMASDMEERVDKLTLICWAMWTLIQEETKLTEEDLLERVRKLDLLDGSPDGKVTRQVAKCSKCSRVMAPRHIRCLYCGNEKLHLSAFDALM